MLKQSVAILSLVLLASPLMADIYKHVDSSGTVTFSDVPNAQTPPSDTTTTKVNYSIKILSPKMTDILVKKADNTTGFSVKLEIIPELKKGDTVRLVLDDLEYPADQPLVFTSGVHHLYAKIMPARLTDNQIISEKIIFIQQ